MHIIYDLLFNNKDLLQNEAERVSFIHSITVSVCNEIEFMDSALILTLTEVIHVHLTKVGSRTDTYKGITALIIKMLPASEQLHDNFLSFRSFPINAA